MARTAIVTVNRCHQCPFAARIVWDGRIDSRCCHLDGPPADGTSDIKKNDPIPATCPLPVAPEKETQP